MYQNILLEKSATGVATITFNRPKVFNSFNQLTCQEIQAALDDCQNDETVRCIVLTGEGKAFCAGQDLGEITGENPPTFDDILDNGYNPIVLRIKKSPKPIIAAVNGVAAGAGANFALACDITIATESASFIQAFSKIGLIPDSGGTFTLPRLVGLQKAVALMMTGEKVSAKDAEAMGMIYKAVADTDFEAAVAKMANTIAQMPTKALGLIKSALSETFSNTLEQQLAKETELQGKAASTEDYAEGVTAFMEKRQPIFKGK